MRRQALWPLFSVLLSSCILGERNLCPDEYTAGDPDCAWKFCKEHPDDRRCADASTEPPDADSTVDAVTATDAGADDAGADARSDAGMDATTLDASDASDARADTGSACMCVPDSGKPVCIASSAQCVECTSAQHCSAQKPACSSNQCVGCTTGAECNGRAETPACNASTGACVECTAASATLCTAAGKVCKTGGANCVECNQDTDCPLAAKAKCDTATNTCVPCDTGGQCAHVVVNGNSDLDVCTAGTCVQCTPATEATECGANACNPDTLACTNKARGTVATCGACNADSECGADHKCIKVPFMGAEGDYRCMRLVPGSGCPNPYQGAPITARSKNGLPNASYCSHNTNVTTCDAITALTSGRACTLATVASDCGQGARCQVVNTVPNRCTYSCSSDLTCPADASCNEQNGSEPNPYCGGP